MEPITVSTEGTSLLDVYIEARELLAEMERELQSADFSRLASMTEDERWYLHTQMRSYLSWHEQCQRLHREIDGKRR